MDLESGQFGIEYDEDLMRYITIELVSEYLDYEVTPMV